MSLPQNGREMGRPPPATGGSVRRAREEAELLTKVNASSTARFRMQNQTPRPQLQVSISRPTQLPQWPLAGPIPSPVGDVTTGLQYQPPAGRSPPQRPPRPSVAYSILDGSFVQDPVPSFHYAPQGQPEQQQQLQPQQQSTSADGSPPPMPVPLSRPFFLPVGPIPDFPVPEATSTSPMIPSRRSLILGPPPSSRRGASSFYSSASFVSPIPEETLLSRSRASLASSAAIPSCESWGSGSLVMQSPTAFSPNEGELSDTLTNDPDNSFYDDEDDESASVGDFADIADFADDGGKLVRSASLGKRATPALVITGTPSVGEGGRPAPSPLQATSRTTSSSDSSPLSARYVGASSSSSQALPTKKTMQSPQPGNPATDRILMANAMLGAYAAAASPASRSPLPKSPSPSPSPSPLHPPMLPPLLGMMRRPPATDIRASMTSLPDMIKRATRLVTFLDKGKRPASQYGIFAVSPSSSNEKGSTTVADDDADFFWSDQRQSGFSDMLAAFPPPVHAPPARRSGPRESWFRAENSLPLNQTPTDSDTPPIPPRAQKRDQQRDQQRVSQSIDTPTYPYPYPDEKAPIPYEKPARQCFGLQRWVCILLIMAVTAILIMAITIPLLFFVFKIGNASGTAEPSLAQCQGQLSCANGGTNVVSQGVCSCICTGGFTGSTCETPATAGCTTTNLMGPEGETTFSNVTLGNAIPRLVANARGNYNVPLSGTDILAKFSTESLSCVAQNSLVTFNGQSFDSDKGPEDPLRGILAAAVQDDDLEVVTLTVPPGESQVVTMAGSQAGHGDWVTTISAATVTVRVTVTVRPTRPPSTLDLLTTTISRPSTTATTVSTRSSISSSTNPISIIPPSNTAPSASAPAPTDVFSITDDVLDFSRVAVLFVLQKNSLDEAMDAQTALQTFLTSAGEGKGILSDTARNIHLGGDNTVNLVDFSVNAGTGPVGARQNTLLKSGDPSDVGKIDPDYIVQRMGWRA